MKGVHIGPDRPPEANRTLALPILAWCSEYLLQPDGPDAGEPWKFTREQTIFLANWYAIDERGRFVYRSGMLRRMKGWGKDPFGAALCLVELLGPCRFGGWKATGMPSAVPHEAPWIQTAAVSQEQTRNTTTLIPAMLSKRAIARYKVELGKTIVYALGGRARLEAVTSSPKALEGGRATFVLKNETHHWGTTNEGIPMSAVIARNAAKSRDGASRVLAISNAHAPNEVSDARADYEAWAAIATGRSRATGFLYDSLEAPPDVELVPQPTGEDGGLTEEDIARARASLRDGILAARGDSHWLDPETLIETIYDPRTPASVSRRYYLNQIIAAEDAWLAPTEWNACGEPEKAVTERELVTLGFDGSKNNDHSALVGCRVEDGHVFLVGAWDPADRASGEIPMAEVDEAVRAAFTRYDVAGFYSDYHPFESYVDRWEQDLAENLCVRPPGGHSIRCVVAGGMGDDSTRQIITVATDSYHDAIVERGMTHDGDMRLAQYHYNARRRPNRYGIAIGKESAFSSQKIDGAMAAVLAWKARQDYLALPENKRRQPKRKAGITWA